MNTLIIATYGIYLLMVGFSGNSDELLQKVKGDAPAFLPWAISLGVLAAMYENGYTRDIAKPFLFLLILTFILKNFNQLQNQMRELYAIAEGAVK